MFRILRRDRHLNISDSGVDFVNEKIFLGSVAGWCCVWWHTKYWCDIIVMQQHTLYNRLTLHPGMYILECGICTQCLFHSNYDEQTNCKDWKVIFQIKFQIDCWSIVFVKFQIQSQWVLLDWTQSWLLYDQTTLYQTNRQLVPEVLKSILGVCYATN